MICLCLLMALVLFDGDVRCDLECWLQKTLVRVIENDHTEVSPFRETYITINLTP